MMLFQTCLLQYYTARCRDLQEQFRRAAAYCDPDGVHDLRVDIKQLRSFFRLVEWMTPRFAAKKHLRVLRMLFKAAADLRDIHVQQEVARGWAEELGVFFSEYYNCLKQKEHPARAHFLAFAEHFDLDEELEKNKKHLAHSLAEVDAKTAAARLQSRITHLLEQISANQSETGFQEEQLHQIRILAKETRYIAQIALQCFPDLGYDETFSQRLRQIHHVLGQWHDTEIALAHLNEFLTVHAELVQAPDPLTDPRFYEKLTQKLREDKAGFLATFEAGWNDFLLRCICQQPC